MKKIIATEKAPAAIGPYSQATEAAGLVFVSGQLPIDPATGAFPEGVEAQTRQSLTNGKAILEKAGLDMGAVLKTTVFLSDMNNFGAMNGVYAEFFPEQRTSFVRLILSARPGEIRALPTDDRGILLNKTIIIGGNYHG